MRSTEREGMAMEELELDACYEKLRTATIGRLGVTVNALPVVLPVNFAVDGHTIVIRTTPGTKLTAAVDEAVVAFEVDDYDPDEDKGWSILVQGRASEIKSSTRLERVRSLSLGPVTAGGTEDRFIAVEMDIVTGRIIEPIKSGNSHFHP